MLIASKVRPQSWSASNAPDMSVMFGAPPPRTKIRFLRMICPPFAKARKKANENRSDLRARAWLSRPFDRPMGPGGRRRRLRLSPSLPLNRRAFQESLGGDQIGRAKSFAELSVDRSQQLQRILFAAAPALKLHEVAGRPQLPGSRSLQSGGVKALVEQGFDFVGFATA